VQPPERAPVRDPSLAPAGVRPSDPVARFLGYLRRHPIICLALLTPGLPEYLSTSSPLLNLVENPAFFFLQLAINVGQYTAGALLVREAVIRWRKGWATVFLLGSAYGILEEGIGDQTLVNSTHGADGVLGTYGRFAGVNWVWSTGVLAFHVVYSIGLPILLLGLALPSTRGRSLIGSSGILVAFVSLAVTTSTESLLVERADGFWLGVPLVVSALGAIVLLVLAGWKAPSGGLVARGLTPRLTPLTSFLVGFAVFPLAFVLEYGFAGTRVPAGLVIATELVAFALLLELVRRRIGLRGNEYALVHLAFGFVVWQCVFGVLLTIGLPYTIPLVILVIIFFQRLRRRYAPTSPVRAALPEARI